MKPLVTIAMPVYNEERFLGEALQSLQAQTLRNFELVISDNASTDRTGDICRLAAERDSRIRYLRSLENVGAAGNFNRLIGEARGRYFMWAGGHDRWGPELVANCVATLDSQPLAVVAVAECEWIDLAGRPLARRSGWTDTSGMSAIERLFTILWGNMHPVLGLMRTDALRATAGMQACMGADLVLLCELALRGDFVFAANTRWYRRDIRPHERYDEMMARYRGAQYRLALGRAARWPLLALGTRLLGVAWNSPLPVTARLAACMAMAAAMPARYYGARLRRQ